MRRTVEDIKAEIFMLEMKDNWNNDDFELSRKLQQELKDMQDETRKNI